MTARRMNAVEVSIDEEGMVLISQLEGEQLAEISLHPEQVETVAAWLLEAAREARRE